jgi:hypothetical protein
MPMIDVYAPDDLFPPDSDRRLGEQLTLAILRAESVTSPAPFHLDNTAAFIHRICGDPSQTQRTWVLLTEAAEGGWGINGTAYGREEFAALAKRR